MATQTLTVSASVDDGNWYSGGINLLGSNLLVGLVSGFYVAHSWIRWQFTADVAQFSVINSATLSARKSYTGAPASGFSALAKFVNQSNPANPANVSAAEALWSSAAPGSGNAYTAAEWPDWNDVASLDLTTALQDLVNARAISNGEYVMLILRDNGSTGYYRPLLAHESAPSPYPTLAFDWTAAPSGNRRRRALIGC
jgi:hypothetical protein